jgi:hypothetical protein
VAHTSSDTVMCIQIGTDSSTQIEHLNVKMHLYTQRPPIDTDKPIFIFAGRGADAYIPDINPQSENNQIRPILVITTKQFETLRNKVTSGVDLLVVEALQSPTHQEYLELGLLNSRRIAAFICAMYLNECFKIPHAIMSDDNIRAVYLNPQINSSEVSNWHSFFNEMTNQLVLADSVCVSLATISTNQLRKNREGELGSKIFMFDLNQLNEKLQHDMLQYFVPFYPAIANNFWGEDYYFQLMFAHLFSDRGVGYKVLPSEQYGIVRATKSQNICQSVMKPVEALVAKRLTTLLSKKSILLLNEMHYHENKSALFIIGCTLKELQDSVVRSMEIYKKIHISFENTDLMLRHAKANSIPYAPKNITYRPAIDDVNFIPQLRKTLEELAYRPGFLKDYQQILIQQLITKLDDQQSSPEGFFGQFKMATGTGKTYIQAILAFATLLTGTRRPIIVVTPQKCLVEQTYRDFLKITHRSLKLNRCSVTAKSD